MRMKIFDKMKWHKQDKMKKFRAFDKLKKFSKDFDKGGRGINEASCAKKLNTETNAEYRKRCGPRPLGQIPKIFGEQKEIKKTIGIYGGRFQPFHSGHMATYKWLKSKVDDVYITTSNIKKPPRHPMNFKEKVEHMVKMGVPKNRIVEEKTPYIANNVLKKFNPNTTAVVYAFGAKDAGRLKGGRKKDGGKTYYQDYKKSKGDIKGFEEHGYFVTAPQSGNLSGTKTREMLGKPNIDDKEKIKFFKKAFGYYDKKMYISMTKNFGKMFEIYVSLLETTITGGIDGVDDGPHMIAPGVNRYIGRAKKEAEKLGFDIVNSLVNADAYNSQDKLKSHAK